MNKTMTPKIRFKGYTNAWEQQTLGDRTDFVLGKSFSKELSPEGRYVVMDMGSVTQEGVRVETKRTDTYRDELKQDDLIMPKDDIGGGFIIAKTVHVPLNGQYLLGDHVYRLRFVNDNGLFMHYLINGNQFNSRVKRKVTGSAQLGIKASNIATEEIKIPNLQEQKTIASLFSRLDDLISLHQRKCFNIEVFIPRR